MEASGELAAVAGENMSDVYQICTEMGPKRAGDHAGPALYFRGYPCEQRQQ